MVSGQVDSGPGYQGGQPVILRDYWRSDGTGDRKRVELAGSDNFRGLVRDRRCFVVAFHPRR